MLLNYITSYFLEILIILVFLLIIIYFSSYIRIFYYVLKLPGPPAYPIVGNALLLLGKNQDATSNLIKLFEESTSLFRVWIGPMPLVCIYNPDFIQEILTNSNSLEKGFFLKHLGKEPFRNSLIVAEVSKWKHKRRILARGFTPLILKSYFKIFVKNSLMLVEKLDTKLNDAKSFDIFEYLSKASLDSICGSTMGVNINAQNSNSAYYSALESIMYLSIDRLFHFWQIPEFLYSWSKNCKKLKKDVATIMEFTDKVILEKQKNYSNSIYTQFNELKENEKNEFKKPLLEYMIDFTVANSNFTDDDLRDETNLVIMAGYETSSNAMSFILLNLAAHKDIQNKVCEELYDVLEGDLTRTIAVDDLPKLKYMEMVMKESMRLYSTAPFLNRKTTKDIQLGDWLIPKGISIAISTFSVHRDEKIWKNPLKFDPERFSLENIKNLHPYAYIPFSGGPRNCLGVRYAWMFMKTVLATLLSRYEFHTDLNMNELQFEMAVTLRVAGGHQIRITRRNNNMLKIKTNEENNNRY